MAAVAAGAAIAGAGLAAYGAIQSAQDQAAIERQRADISRQQASEILSREQANEVLRNDATYKAKLDFSSSFAASGHEGGGVGSQLEIQRQSDVQNMVSRRDAEFQAAMYRKSGDIYSNLAGSTEQAGYISAAGSLLGGAGQAAGRVPTGSSPSVQSAPTFTG